MKELYLWPINADQQGTPKQVRKVIDTIKSTIFPPSLARVRFPINPPARSRVNPARIMAAYCMSIL